MYRLPEASAHPADIWRAPGSLPDAGTPCCPQFGYALTLSEPPSQVHWLLLTLYIQTSFRSAWLPYASVPAPDHSHRFPEVSFQPTAEERAPGTLLGPAEYSWP